MKILLISDIESKYLWDYFDARNFMDIDLIISCGDLKAEYMSYIVTMMKVPLFYISGNHDDDFFTNPPGGCDCIDDKFVKYKGIRILGFGGSKKYNEGKFQYTDRQMIKRVRKMRTKLFFNKGFDILVTHAGGLGIGDDKDKCHEGFKVFNWLMDKYSPKYFFHGHTHLSYNNSQRVSTYKDTTVVNAYGYYVLEY
jgi:Icc-related predicted phosphoesterase